MMQRPFWIERIEKAWKKRPLVWLSGVRRVGKTTIAGMFPEAIYLNCDLLSAGRRLEDPEQFFHSCKKNSVVILDEVHRLKDPSRVLKIAADEFSHLRILATGSSTLSATKKFRDSLTGRKTMVFLPPVLFSECAEVFRIHDLDRRLLHGGLPEQLLAKEPDQQFFSEWLDSFYARDIQELFGIRERAGFLNLLKTMLIQSGGLADYSALSRECEISRITVKSHLEAMTVAHAMYPLRPFHGGSKRELAHRPKIYAFDTGFICACRGCEKIRPEDRGLLWEHLVLDTLRVTFSRDNLGFWRDKSGREIDFVTSSRGKVDAIECKINPDRFDSKHLQFFRGLYPSGTNYLVSPGISEPYEMSCGGLPVHVVSCDFFLRHSDE
ncbi:MAG: ATP-binding protein [Candidatus Wallbacteria bacterium]|nr:ATP-binding protein [Candidatus Wallbacteria bacterium]